MRHAMIAMGIVLAMLASANAAVLYDGTQGTLPAAQGWNYRAIDLSTFVVQATQAASGGKTTLDTMADIDDMAGYYSEFTPLGDPKHPLLGTLDRTGDGYTVRITAQLVAESHASSNRAGFSLIVLSSDGMGVEVGFWMDAIWAQEADFTHDPANEAAYLTNAVVIYDLAVQGSTFALYGNGSLILNGTLVDYSAEGAPYTETSFIFFGDDTSSAQAEVNVFHVETFDEAIPEPATLILLTAGAGALIRRRR